MKIEVSPKDYRRLLLMLSVADWVLNANEVDEPKGFRLSCAGALSRFLRHAPAMGFEDLVNEMENGALVFSNELDMDPDVRGAIDDYDAHTFWTELVSRLAERDYAKIHGMTAVAKVTEPDFEEMEEELAARLDELDELEKVYWAEFEPNGIESLHIVRGMSRPS